MAKTKIDDLPKGAAEMDPEEQKAAKGGKRAGSAPNRPALGQRPLMQSPAAVKPALTVTPLEADTVAVEPAPPLTGKLLR